MEVGNPSAAPLRDLWKVENMKKTPEEALLKAIRFILSKKGKRIVRERVCAFLEEGR